MKVVQVNIADSKGGACVISWNLHKAYQRAGIDSFIAVKQKFTKDENVFVVNNRQDRLGWSKVLSKLADSVDRKKFYFSHKAAAFIRFVSSPSRMARKSLGIEEFDFPALRVPTGTDIIHCHVLHGD